MKKAIVIGGSNGIGLAIAFQLIDRGYFVEVLDRDFGDLNMLPKGTYHHTSCDLMDFDEELLKSYATNLEIELLMITAGVGRVANFEAHHIAEIDRILTINTVSTLKIFRIFYDRILSKNNFYAGVMGSIAGWISTPAASVYAASKAGVVRFIESVNIELEVAGMDNRILDVSPASFQGSKFYGGKNDLSVTGILAAQIVEHLLHHDTRFIP